MEDVEINLGKTEISYNVRIVIMYHDGQKFVKFREKFYDETIMNKDYLNHFNV